MYNLTDYTLSDLRIIQEPIANRIEELETTIRLTQQHLSGELRDSLILKSTRTLDVLREHNVHLLTAISIVKERETVASN